MSCEAGARVSIRQSKVPSSLGKHPRNLARSALQVRSRRKNCGHSKKQLSFQKPPGSRLRFSRTRVQHFLGSLTIELPSILAKSGAYSPNSTRKSTLTRTAAPYQASRDSITCHLACQWLPKDTTLASGRDAPGEIVQTQRSCHRLPTND